MPWGADWTRRELLLALRLYMGTDFGRLHQRNPEVVALAEAIGRTPSAVAMKACNFASLDPALHQSGLSSTSRADRAIWEEFHANTEALAAEAEALADEVGLTQSSHHAPRDEAPSHNDTTAIDAQSSDDASSDALVTRSVTATFPAGPTDTEMLVRTRRVQSFFRRAILVSYDSRCALTGLRVPSLLVASHIIPWSASTTRRADPTNGLCLSPLFDRAFDRGLITFDEDHRVVLSRTLKEHLPQPHLPCLLTAAAGAALHLPERFPPDASALEYHRDHVFSG